MTQEQAVDEARRRWWLQGRAWTERISASTTACCVGKKIGRHNSRLGMGIDWEDAFADADRRAAQPEEDLNHGSE